jgi:hypothetical protein
LAHDFENELGKAAPCSMQPTLPEKEKMLRLELPIDYGLRLDGVRWNC